MDGSFNSLPFPIQLMQFRQMQAQEAARRQAGQVLYDQFPQSPMPQQQPLPAPPPGTPAGGAQPPPPGAMSPGGGNPMAPGGASVMAPPGGGMPPPPMMRGAAPGGAQPAQQPIPPFRSMPSSPPAPPMAGGGGQVPPPPASPSAAPAPDAGQQPHPMDLKNIMGSLRKSGVPPERVMDMLDTLAPAMNAQNKQELEFFKANNQALKAANDAYAKVMTAMASQQRADTGVRAEDRRRDQGDQNLQIKRDKETRLRQQAAAAAGGAGSLQKTEFLYPKGDNGQPDTTKPPIGVRGITKSGKIINLDAEGNQTAGQQGDPAPAKGSQKDTVRGNLVEGSAHNAINRLNEIRKLYPGGTTSVLFGTSGDGPVSRGAHGLVRGAQNEKTQDIDAKWASFIDEAIPVFTGGLRGSDAFRRFLIEQAPGPGTKPKVVAEKMRLFEENIKGTQKAFANKFKTDPSMWAPGVTKDQVNSGGAAPQQQEWKVEKVGG